LFSGSTSDKVAGSSHPNGEHAEPDGEYECEDGYPDEACDDASFISLSSPSANRKPVTPGRYLFLRTGWTTNGFADDPSRLGVLIEGGGFSLVRLELFRGIDPVSCANYLNGLSAIPADGAR